MLKFFKDRDFYHPFIIWFLVICWYFIFAHYFFDTLRLKTQDVFTSDAFYIFHQPPQETKKIVIVSIDETSRTHIGLKWPWNRSVTAQLIRNIASFSPKAIGLDIIFSGQSQENEDKQLSQALGSHPNIVLGHVLGEGSKELPLPEFIEAAKNIGFINKPLDRNNVLKNIRNFYIEQDGKINFSFDIELVAKYLDVSYKDFKLDEKGIYLADKLFIPSKNGITPLNYLTYYTEFTAVPAFLVLENRVSPDIFKDKIVLVGATDPLIHDEYQTPMGVFPAITIIANSLVMMLSKRFVLAMPFYATVFIIFFLGILVLYINKKATFTLASLFTFLILPAVFFILLYLRSKDIEFDYLSIFLLTFSAYIISNAYKYSSLIYMRNKLKNLAIVESMTGFYTLRFFSLKLDERMDGRQERLAFLAVVISEYGRISLELSFEESKSLIKSLAEYVKFNIERKFKSIMLCQVSRDILGVAIYKQDREKIEDYFKALQKELAKVDFNLGEKTIKISVKGILVYKNKNTKVQSKDIIYKMKSLLENIKAQPRNDFVSSEIEGPVLRADDRHPDTDILDFLVHDLEEKNKDLERALKDALNSKKEADEAYFEVTRSLIKALGEKDTYTEGHSERVARYAKEIAVESGLSEDECSLIYRAALLHDIGKMALPDYILHKKEKLSEEEIDMIKKHEINSVNILKPIKAFSDILPIILYHHEKFDGTGYPYGLSGNMIPKEAQILSVADVFDAITCGRGYKEGKSATEAIEEMERQKGKQLSPAYVDILKKVLKI